MNTRTSLVKLASEVQPDDIVDITSVGCYYGSRLRFFKITAVSRRVSKPDTMVFMIKKLLADGTDDKEYLERSIFVSESCRVRLPTA